MHPDHISYFAFTPKSRLDKAMKSLAGIIEGISIDAEINKKELSFLSDWVRECEDVRNKHPFNGVGVRSCNSTLKKIAEHPGFHYAAMSRAIKWVERV